jgi:hypothetical protein
MSKLNLRFWDQDKNINFHLQKSGGYDCSLETGGRRVARPARDDFCSCFVLLLGECLYGLKRIHMG